MLYIPVAQGTYLSRNVVNPIQYDTVLDTFKLSIGHTVYNYWMHEYGEDKKLLLHAIKGNAVNLSVSWNLWVGGKLHYLNIINCFLRICRYNLILLDFFCSKVTGGSLICWNIICSSLGSYLYVWIPRTVKLNPIVWIG